MNPSSHRIRACSRVQSIGERNAVSKPAFIHLHNHTEYSLLDSTIRIHELIAKAKAFSMSAVAITDSGNMCGAVEFYFKCASIGIKPIIGCEITVTSVLPGSDSIDAYTTGYKLVLLCMNLTGYRNLCRVVTIGCRNGVETVLPVSPQDVSRHSEGLICLSGGISGELAILCQGYNLDDAKTAAAWYEDVFPGRYYIELYDDNNSGRSTALSNQKEVSQVLGIPQVVANNCRYLNPEDTRAYHVLQCMKSGVHLSEGGIGSVDGIWFKSQEEMQSLFSDYPEAMSNTLVIADRCSLELPFAGYHLPHDKISAGMADEVLEKMAMQGLKERLASPRFRGHGVTAEVEQLYRDRLKLELESLKAMDLSHFFLSVTEYVTWA